MSYNKGENDQKKMNEEKINQDIYKDFEHKFNPWDIYRDLNPLKKLKNHFMTFLLSAEVLPGLV